MTGGSDGLAICSNADGEAAAETDRKGWLNHDTRAGGVAPARLDVSTVQLRSQATRRRQGDGSTVFGRLSGTIVRMVVSSSESTGVAPPGIAVGTYARSAPSLLGTKSPPDGCNMREISV